MSHPLYEYPLYPPIYLSYYLQPTYLLLTYLTNYLTTYLNTYLTKYLYAVGATIQMGVVAKGLYSAMKGVVAEAVDSSQQLRKAVKSQMKRFVDEAPVPVWASVFAYQVAMLLSRQARVQLALVCARLRVAEGARAVGVMKELAEEQPEVVREYKMIRRTLARLARGQGALEVYNLIEDVINTTCQHILSSHLISTTYQPISSI